MPQHISPRAQQASTRAQDLRIVVVDDHPIVRKGLAELINQQPGMTVVGEGDALAAGLARIRADRPDVAIVDLSLGSASGLDLVKTLNATQPEVRVLMLSMHDETLYAERALAAGANGYIMKDEAMGNLIGAIRCVASGKTYVSPQMSERIVARVTGRGGAAEEPEPLARLTDREREVFTLMGRGLETRAVAAQLELSVKTIETYHARIKEKLGLKTAHELIRAAVSWAGL